MASSQWWVVCAQSEFESDDEDEEDGELAGGEYEPRGGYARGTGFADLDDAEAAQVRCACARVRVRVFLSYVCACVCILRFCCALCVRARGLHAYVRLFVR